MTPDHDLLIEIKTKLDLYLERDKDKEDRIRGLDKGLADLRRESISWKQLVAALTLVVLLMGALAAWVAIGHN